MSWKPWEWDGLIDLGNESIINQCKIKTMTNKAPTKEDLLKNPLVKKIAEEFYESGYDDWNEFIDAIDNQQDKKATQAKKEWEILSLLNEGGDVCKKTNEKTIHTDEFKYICPDQLGFLLVSNLSNPRIKIYSVKRLSDSEIFTIGDQVKGIYTSKFVIDQFTIVKDDMQVWAVNQVGKSAMSNIGRLTKIKKVPLFTTEDGVEIFEGDKFYWIHVVDWRPMESVAGNNFFKTAYTFPVFSTKETADEWILMNKPCLSAKDVLEYLGHGATLNTMPELEKLVKFKINA